MLSNTFIESPMSVFQCVRRDKNNMLLTIMYKNTIGKVHGLQEICFMKRHNGQKEFVDDGASKANNIHEH